MVEMGLIYSHSVHNYTWGNTFDKKPIVIHQCLSRSISVVAMQQFTNLDLLSDCQQNLQNTSVLQRHKSLPPEILKKRSHELQHVKGNSEK